MNVGDSSDDNLRTVHAARHVPTEAWLEAFYAQCTETMLKRLRRYARLLARRPCGELLGDPVAYAEEVTQTAVADVADGVLRWEPPVRDLEPYLADVIRLRVRRDRRRAARDARVSLDAPHQHDRTSLLDEMNTRIEMTTTLRRLRELVAVDPLALRFIDAIEQTATTRAEIMKLAGLTRTEYHNTRRRLARLLARLRTDRQTPAKDN